MLINARPKLIKYLSAGDKLSMWHSIINAVLFQGLWFSIMLLKPLATVFFLCALLSQFFYRRHVSDRNLSLALPIKVFVFGILMDTSFTLFGLLSFPENQLHSHITGAGFFTIPLWLIVMWLGFVFTLQHSLQWLRVKKHACIVTFSIFGALSYLAGRRFGVIEFSHESIVFLLLGWAAVGWIASHRVPHAAYS